jgi:hypothetical protein
MGFYVEFGGKVPSASHAARATHVAACLVERGMGAPDCAALYRFVGFIRDGGAVEDVPAALDKEQRTREVAQAIAAAQLPVLFSDHDLFRAYVDGGPAAPGVMAPAAAAAEILARRTEAEERCARCGVDLDGPLPDLAGSIDGWVARGGARCDLKEENLCGMGEARYKELMRIADTEVLNQRAIEKRLKARLPEKHLPGFQERYRAWAAAGFGDGFEELLASIVESEGRAHAAEMAEKTRRTQGARLRREAGLPAEYLHTFFADRCLPVCLCVGGGAGRVCGGCRRVLPLSAVAELLVHPHCLVWHGTLAWKLTVPPATAPVDWSCPAPNLAHTPNGAIRLSALRPFPPSTLTASRRNNPVAPLPCLGPPRHRQVGQLLQDRPPRPNLRPRGAAAAPRGRVRRGGPGPARRGAARRRGPAGPDQAAHQQAAADEV